MQLLKLTFISLTLSESYHMHVFYSNVLYSIILKKLAVFPKQM